MFVLEIAFYKAKYTSGNGISMRHSLTVEHVMQTTLGIAKICISDKQARWFTQASSPPVANS